ncbi:hypothetical protein ACEN4E_10580 [Latilactobacillus sakei]|uniref:hypothetical protein n=1 Tax=Latilactobacillus sakei TaxID=1599 RepID=UPI003889DDF1
MKIKKFSYKSLAWLFGITVVLNIIALILGIALHKLDGWDITFLGLMVFDMAVSVIECGRELGD